MNPDLSERIARLDPQRRDLFLQLMQKRAQDAANAGEIPLHERGRPLPLSFAQQRLWFLDRLNPGSPAYNVGRVFRLEGPLSVTALSQSLSEVVRRHEILRTTFPLVDGLPVQQASASVADEIKHINLMETLARDREEWANTLAVQEIKLPFDLSAQTPWRACLIQYEEASYLFILVVHHIAIDGWSLSILLRELSQLYAAFQRGHASTLPPLPVQYANFALWEKKQWAVDADQARLVSYWKDQLAGIPDFLPLPTDFPRRSGAAEQGALEPIVISAKVTEGAGRLANRLRVTLPTVLLAGLNALVARYIGQEDVVIAQAVSNRGRSEFESLIGPFVNLLPLRTNLSGRPTFAGLVERVHQVVLDAHAHQDIPFQKIVEAASPDQSQELASLGQLMFGFENFPDHALVLDGVQVSSVNLDAMQKGAAKSDLSFSLGQKGDHLAGMIEYRTGLFDPSRIRRLSNHLEILMEHAVSAPATRVEDLRLSSSEERRMVAVQWNQTRSDFPRDRSIAELFEQVAERHPQSLALKQDNQELTYQQLNARANQWAHYLMSRGVGVETPVVLYAERSLPLLVALVGIVKVGGTYVPLDPQQPRERVEMLLEDAGRPLVIAEVSQAENLPPGTQVLLLQSPETEEQLSSMPANNPGRRVAGENLAYVMFTSGSTGVPKGVMVTHRNVVRLVKGSDYIQPDEKEIFLQLATLAFDASTFEIWGPLLNGGALVMAEKDTALNPAELRSTLKRERITTIFLTTALFHLVAREEKGIFRGIRNVLFGGELADPRWVAEAAGEKGPERLLHVYGPTETTTFATWFQVSKVQAEQQTIPIGRPVANTRLYVVDKDMQLSPLGVDGELCIGGGGVARGYLHRPELTAERFVPDPFSGEPGARLYRSGDRVRFRPDSNLEFLGRNDDQVKIRGFRIELGEVETALQAHPQVSAAVALLREDQPGDKRLVAYVTLKAGSDALRGDQLREHLEHSLPAYMVPARLVVLPELPLNANGKVDRQALPAPDWRREEGDGPRQGPRNRIEEALVEIWAEVLDIDPQQISITDNFFSLGGHSLQASQVSTRIQAMRNYKLPLRWLFETPTIAELAQRLAEAIASGPEFLLPAIEPLRDGRPVPCSYAQEGLWFLHQLEPENAVYNVSVNILLRGDLDVAVLTRALRQVVERHEVLRTSLQMRDGQLVQEVSGPALSAVPLLDLSGFAADTRRAALDGLMLEEAQRQFDLSRDHLLRAQLVRIEKRTHALLLTFHHSVFDGWSASVLAREISAIYTALQRGQEASLPPLRYQYRDFALMEREVLRGPLMDKMRQYWSSRLESAPQVLDLPTDYPRPKKHRFAGSIYRAVLPAGVREALQSMSAREGSTLFPALLAAYRMLLARYSGQKDILIGVPVANRWSRHFEDLIGFFANTLPFRTELAGNLSFRKLVKAETETMLEAMAHCYLPFGRLVEMLQLERNIGFNPGVQVMFVMQNGVDLTLQIPGIVSERLPVNTNSAKLDITLAMESRDDGMAMLWEYSSELFQPDTIARMARHFGVLLEDALARPDAPVDTLEILTQAERQQLTEWNHTQEAYRIHHQAEIQAEDDSTPGPAKTGGSFPIGRPIANTQTYVLDADLNPRPAGLPGELYLGGLGLARGYLGRPALTAERFLPNPFSAGGARLYRTGDRARYRPDGALEFLGRIDSQIKMGGFRIEPGEIEAVMLKHGSVSAAVVLPWEGPAGTRHLVAYVVAQAGVRLTQEALREHVSSELPAYMRPHIFVLLDSMPLTPNGKVDRKALPAPDSVGPSATGSSISPNNALEVRIRQIWQKLLPVKEPGMEDNFFDLGGYSLLAFQVFDHLKGSFPALTMTDIFTYPTIRSLARHLDQGDKETAATDQGQSRGRLRKRLKEARPRPLAAAAAVHSAVPQDKQEI